MFILLLSVLSCAAFSSDRVLLAHESKVFGTLLGLDDMGALKRVEENPEAFWHERCDALKKGACKTLPHNEFCQRYVVDCKECLTQRLSDMIDPPWFKDLDAIDCVIREFLPEDHHLFQSMRALYYACACDYVRCPSTYFCVVATTDALRRALEKLIAVCADASPEFIEKVRWQILPGGAFSLFDCVVARGQGQYLCAAPSNHNDLDNFCVHSNDFMGRMGVILHDFFTHALAQHRLDLHLMGMGVSAQDVFDICCNAKALAKKDMITLVQQIQAWFFQFREIPSEQGSFSPDDPMSLFFPTSRRLDDKGFLHITPYFMDVPLGFNWHEEPLERALILDDSYVLRQLHVWRSLCCAPLVRLWQNLGRIPARCMNFLREELESLSGADAIRHRALVGFNDSGCLTRMDRLPLLCSEAVVMEQSLLAKNVVDVLEQVSFHCGDRCYIAMPCLARFFVFTLYGNVLSKIRRCCVHVQFTNVCKAPNILIYRAGRVHTLKEVSTPQLSADLGCCGLPK